MTEFGYLGIGVKDADAWREYATHQSEYYVGDKWGQGSEMSGLMPDIKLVPD